MARAWNSLTELHTVTTIGAAKSVARKWAQNLPVWTLSDLFPDGKEKPKTLVIKSIYQITIYLFDKIYIYIFFTFRYCKNKSLRLSDTVSLKYKNAKYITDQQQQLTLNILRFIKKVHIIYLSYSAYFIIKEAIISRLC